MKTIFVTGEKLTNNSAAIIRLKYIISGFEQFGRVTEIYSLSLRYDSNFLYKLISLLHRFIRTMLISIRLVNCDEVYFYGRCGGFLVTFSKILGKTIIMERTEYPSSLLQPESSNRVKRLDKLYLYDVKKADLFVTCSKALYDFYISNNNYKSKFVFVPIIAGSIELEPSINRQELKLSYCGYMGGDKDGVDLLIQQFAIFHRFHPEYKLELIGSGPEKDVARLKNIVEELNLSDSVEFKGKVSHGEVKRLISTAKILLLARPNNLQAKGGFPSKLVDYMSTANPVVCTRVGEIDSVFDEHELIFVDTIEQLSAKILDVVRNYDKYQSVGASGYKAIYKYRTTNIVRDIIDAI
ncbi:glycosyltransferase [Vibrio splendidus]